jgi:predicted transcriptional regulator
MITQIRLLEKMELINIFTKDQGERIERITLTNDGKDFLSEINFTNQQRMGDKP